MKPILFSAIIILLFALTAYGKTYYVAESGADTSNGLYPSVQAGNNGPWKTIDKANKTLQAGDTVFIRGGKYINGMIKPLKTGESASARITYSAYNNEMVTITNTDYAIFFDNKSYMTVSGINFYCVDQFVYVKGSRNIIEYCTFDSMRTRTSWAASRIYGNSQYNRIHHCTFSRWGEIDTLARGAMLDIGTEGDSTDQSNYNLVEDCRFHSGGHHLLAIFSRYNVLRNNYFENDEWLNNKGFRCLISDGLQGGMNLMQANRIAWAGSKTPGDGGSSGFDLRNACFIIRFNCFYKNDCSGICIATVNEAGFTEPHHNYIYNNVFFDNGRNSTDNACFAVSLRAWNGSPASVRRNVFKNNIFYLNRGTCLAWEQTSLDSQTIENNWEQSGNPLFVDSTAPGSKIVDKPDFHLKAASPCIDKGKFLTAITSPTGSGTSFQVQDARYFMDGWNIIEPDEIQLEGQKQRTRITAVNYTDNTISVASGISWTAGQGVGLAYEGISPDQGAFEYSAINIIGKQKKFIDPNISAIVISGSIIKYTVPFTSRITISIFNHLGRLIDTPVDGKLQTPGVYTVCIPAGRFAHGMYIVRFSIGRTVRILKAGFGL
jgi:hypothetical protein